MSTGLAEQYRPLLEAAAFAARAHEGQRRKDKKTPYISHVFRVCLVLRDVFGIDELQALITAALHDTLEDTTTDFDDLAEAFGANVARWVSILSKDKRLEEHERERQYMLALCAAPWQVKACKLADMFDNLMDMGSQAAERHAHTFARIEGYWQALAANPPEQIKAPLELVRRLLEEMRGSRAT